MSRGEKNNKIVIMKSGFIYEYLTYFCEICAKHNIAVEIEEKEENICNHKDFDFILADCLFFPDSCTVFHGVTTLKKIKLTKNLIYRLILHFGHFKRIIKEKNIFHNSHKIFAVSNSVKEDFIENYDLPKEKITVVHPGSTFNNKLESPNFQKKRNEIFTVGMHANGFVTKGGYILLEALKSFRKLYPDTPIKAKIIYPKYEKNLAVKLYVNFFKLNNIVEFLPYQNNMTAFYQSLDCFVCSSVYEAFGRVVPEAMYNGIITISGSNIGAVDIVEDGKNGFIFKKDKNYAQNLVEKIKYIYDNYENLETIKLNAYKTVKDCTWENTAKNIFYSLYPNCNGYKY